MKDGCTYVALGSSFAAGPGLRPRATPSPCAAGRSAINYPHLVARRLGLELDDRSFSGATIAQIAGVEPSRRAEPQVEGVGASTRLVTLTGGGNDVGYIPRLTLASLPRPLQWTPICRRVEALSEPRAVEVAFEHLRADLDTLIHTIRSRSDATIVMTDYLTVLPDDVQHVNGVPQEIALWAKATAARLSATLFSAADHSGAIFVPVGEASATHHAWSDQPWTRAFHFGLRAGAPYHPTAEGMSAVAGLICRVKI